MPAEDPATAAGERPSHGARRPGDAGDGTPAGGAGDGTPAGGAGDGTVGPGPAGGGTKAAFAAGAGLYPVEEKGPVHQV